MDKPIIYQILPRLWGNLNEKLVRNCGVDVNGTGRFKDIDKSTLEYLKHLGVSHVWYTGVIRHATDCDKRGCVPSNPQWVKGDAGSPYSITDYFDVNPYLAVNPEKRMDEFDAMIKRTHAAGLKAIIDFVPNHVARDYGKYSPKPVRKGRDANGHPVLGALDDKTKHWLPDNDFFYYPGQPLKLPTKGTYREMPAKASGNIYSPEPSVNDWYDTVKINYCDFYTDTWERMYEVVCFWASRGVDGFRCDMVELVPTEFMGWLIKSVKKEFPDVQFIAEVYQKNLYGKYVREVGFDYLYDKSGLYDALHDIMTGNVNNGNAPLEQWQSARRITWNWQSLGDLQPHMLNFLENHDEQRLASDFFARKGRNALAAMYVSLLFNTAPFMLYFGQEAGEKGMDEEGMSGKDGRTSIFDWWSPASVRRLNLFIHGKGDLEPEEKALLERYKALLSFASGSDVIKKGVTYDLCYCNMYSAGFNIDKNFAFIRKYGEETILVVSNFGIQDSDMDIMIPSEAFEWLQIPQSESMNASTPVKVHVPACDGVMINLR